LRSGADLHSVVEDAEPIAVLLIFGQFVPCYGPDAAVICSKFMLAMILEMEHFYVGIVLGAITLARRFDVV
jgi:hypothetical protein